MVEAMLRRGRRREAGRMSAAGTAHWLAEPDRAGLPDALRLLSYLADACDEVAG